MDNIHSGHRARLRNKFNNSGLSAFEDHELLELLLSYSIPRSDTNPLAHNLLNEFGSLHGVFDAPLEELVKINGISEYSATLIKMIPDLCYKYIDSKNQTGSVVISGIEELGSFFVKQFVKSTHETVCVAYLDSSKRLLGYEFLNGGTSNSVAVDLKKIVLSTEKYRAGVVAIAHNHPLGKALPSETDIENTHKLSKTLKLMDVVLFDHIIVAGEDWFSLSEADLLN